MEEKLKETILKNNFWSGGINWGGENKLEEFSTNNYWQIGWDKDSDSNSAKEAWKNIREIKVGDLLSFHGYGGRNDLKIYQISKVIGKDEDEGKLLIKKLNSDDDILFHNKAPKMAHGGWFGTLFQVTGEEAINKVFGNYIQGNTQMTKEDEFVENYANLLKNTKNLILTGAPGTGKTFMAKQIAEKMGCTENEICFVQFHPSYDYTDFVEGLRPTDKDGNGNVGFERKDGVFKAFCEKALENLVETPLNNDESQNFDEAWEKLLDEVRENIASEKLTKIGIWEYGLSSTNSLKYESTDTQSKYTFTITKKNVFDAYRGIKARPSGYFQKYMKEVADYMKKYGLKEYKEKSGPEKEKKSQKNFVFIIDEINRGEVAKIFGELFYSVDPGYRVTYDDLDAIKNGNKTVTTIKTQYANLENEGNIFDRVLQKKEKDFGHFFIPENVYIIGTMNDIDRSVESMDFAFRRRFTWAEVKAEDTLHMLDNGLPEDIVEEAKKKMSSLNSAISEIEGLGTAYHIGASYFLKLDNYDGDFDQLWKYHLKGILEEYLRGNPEKDELMKQLEKAYQE